MWRAPAWRPCRLTWSGTWHRAGIGKRRGRSDLPHFTHLLPPFDPPLPPQKLLLRLSLFCPFFSAITGAAGGLVHGAIDRSLKKPTGGADLDDALTALAHRGEEVVDLLVVSREHLIAWVVIDEKVGVSGFVVIVVAEVDVALVLTNTVVVLGRYRVHRVVMRIIMVPVGAPIVGEVHSCMAGA